MSSNNRGAKRLEQCLEEYCSTWSSTINKHVVSIETFYSEPCPNLHEGKETVLAMVEKARSTLHGFSALALTLERAIAAMSDIGDRPGKTMLQSTLNKMRTDVRNYEKKLRATEKNIRTSRKVRDLFQIAFTLQQFADVYSLDQEHEKTRLIVKMTYEQCRIVCGQDLPGSFLRAKQRTSKNGKPPGDLH